MKQLVLSRDLRARVVHGGELSVGVRKVARPIVTKRPMHLVMRSTLAVGSRSFLVARNAKWIQVTVSRLAREHHVQVYEFANSGNHLHLLLRAKTRDGFKSFLRALAGTVAMKIGGACKGRALVRKFWDLPPFTRVVEWGRAFLVAREYVVQNTLEALGFVVRSRGHSPPK